ncbi:tyrosinase 2 [Ophiocordyceps camponoti-floridani]|uniref:Tyrosinase 2 n=1 Tax=Ophiocordyceps camponoti-floridani TaxID=2030778 RepID=A0A8H4Q7B4_9HYPO|nr:tyrosinase 2 [Ophiocordyceps camponoti-floridani]
MLSNAAALLFAFGSASFVLADPYAITGVKVDNGPLPIRRNIDDLEAEKGPQWDLYIQSLSFMYDMDSDDSLSFFQIAGIHGWPFIEWNNTGRGNANSPWAGYCPHGEPIFLPWHRAYVVLYEQSLVSAAKQIASQYPGGERKQYEEAADTLRAPYWDWAATGKVPNATLPDKVKIKTPKGQKEVDNPLANYKFPQQAVQGRYGDLAAAQAERSRPRGEIVRCPSPRSYPDSANAVMSLEQNNRRTQSLRDMVYDTFTTSQNFAEFASTRSKGVSLEQIHNTIHIEATCSADFLNSRVAGYDPLFMLHHSNVDRFWAYWQALHPEDVIFTDSYRGQSRFTTPAGTTVGPDSPLAPFFGANGQAHTSKTVLSIKDFGYSYEGLEYGAKSDSEIKQSAARMINKLYSGQPQEEEPSEDDKPSGGKPSDDKSSDDKSSDDKPSDDKPSDDKSSDDKSSDDKTSTEKPSKGNPSDNDLPDQDSSDNEIPSDNPSGKKPPHSESPLRHQQHPPPPRKAQQRKAITKRHAPGLQHAPETERLGRHAAQPATGVVNGAVFLNNAIQKVSKSGNGSTSAVESNIHCEITKTDGQVIDLSSVPSLKIEVDQVILTPPASETEISRPKERKAEPVSKVSPPPPGSAGSADGPPLAPANQQENGNGGYSPGGDRGGSPGEDQGDYRDGNPKAKPKPEKPVTVSAAGRAGPWPVLVYVSACLLLLV